MSTNDTPDDTNSPNDPDSFSTVGPQCPICESTDRERSSEDIPHSFDRHFVETTCGNCGTRYRIEFRPIDISWTDGSQETHSAVSQGRIEPTEQDYLAAEQFAKLPDGDLLSSIDWPVTCDCGEELTGNHLVTEPLDGPVPSPDQTLLLRCPACQEDKIVSPETDH